MVEEAAVLLGRLAVCASDDTEQRMHANDGDGLPAEPYEA